ncbi:hypothetical protein ATN84_03235 [Paramesorhizobium deserti]|uniref:Lnb N-terminal periplasmic domain-containing protein n=1 Tax=Paramesorhizobium deserti TaxID=1494590 RepID=A0A135I038_9HYPH|nr:DUF4105 domain-containing protein [Paramesorhizobium deserti]KXF78795.1 hypothetical protein ATN84_03235 [Paramesorhizobium deserti]
MTTIFASILRFIGRVLFFLVLACCFIWGGFALWYHLPLGEGGRIAVLTVWGAFSLTMLMAEFTQKRRQSRFAAGIAMLALFGWWSMIRPSLTRDWAPDVEHTVTARIDGNQATLYNVRDFDWRTTTDFTPHWKTETYDLDGIETVDLFLSYWAGPAIAHTLVSFGFADGRHIVFSAEIRKTRDEAFSEIGGFFKEFELAMIAAKESDIIRLRTNIRGERVYRYPIRIDAAAAKALFLLYLDTANRLAKKAEFYNTVTTNCTTVVFDMARTLNPGFPLDYRVLLSGYLPGYLYDEGLIANGAPLAEVERQAAIGSRADGGPIGYSVRIRDEWVPTSQTPPSTSSP